MKCLVSLFVVLTLASCALPTAPLRSVAVRVHDMDAMVGFYGEAFGFRFEPVDTNGLASMFGTNGEVTLKFVPLREAPDFEGFPSHQLGFEVDGTAGLDAVGVAAERFGGGQFERDAAADHVAFRDPDGNTIEVYVR